MKNSLRHVVVRDPDGTRIAISQDDIEIRRMGTSGLYAGS